MNALEYSYQHRRSNQVGRGEPHKALLSTLIKTNIMAKAKGVRAYSKSIAKAKSYKRVKGGSKSYGSKRSMRRK